ncbi:MAG: PEP-CTERM sorting domain-containing protein [Gemmatimonadaceae bacterium]|nr:PEP-CTERM sorting domain-containing protein [Gemmatimonadaceae bacterium]
MRLVLQDKFDQISELIWEGYYNRGTGEALNGAVTPVDQWVTTSNMQNGNFWFNRPPTAPGLDNVFVGTGCQDNLFTFWQGGIPGSALNQLLGSGGCLANADAKVIGIAVGVGSQWPLPYHGFVDNVQMGFNNQNGLALDANFDFVPTSTVPEPSTYALMATGLAALGLAARRRRQRKASAK